jgi:hypothetical protein
MQLGKGQISDMSTRQNEAHEPLAEICGQKAIDNELPVVYLFRHGETAYTVAGPAHKLIDLTLTLRLAGLAHRRKWRGLPC